MPTKHEAQPISPGTTKPDSPTTSSATNQLLLGRFPVIAGAPDGVRERVLLSAGGLGGRQPLGSGSRTGP